MPDRCAAQDIRVSRPQRTRQAQSCAFISVLLPSALLVSGILGCLDLSEIMNERVHLGHACSGVTNLITDLPPLPKRAHRQEELLHSGPHRPQHVPEEGVGSVSEEQRYQQVRTLIFDLII